MSTKNAILPKFVGFVVAVLGAAVLAFVLVPSYPHYAKLLNSQASIFFAFLFSVGLLIFASGISIFCSGSLSQNKSLVPRWVLGVSGSLMLFSAIGLAIIQSSNSRSIVGLAIFGALGIYWLRSAFRNVI